VLEDCCSWSLRLSLSVWWWKTVTYTVSGGLYKDVVYVGKWCLKLVAIDLEISMSGSMKICVADVDSSCFVRAKGMDFSTGIG
jgi:hypothetical protein